MYKKSLVCIDELKIKNDSSYLRPTDESRGFSLTLDLTFKGLQKLGIFKLDLSIGMGLALGLAWPELDLSGLVCAQELYTHNLTKAQGLEYVF